MMKMRETTGFHSKKPSPRSQRRSASRIALDYVTGRPGIFNQSQLSFLKKNSTSQKSTGTLFPFLSFSLALSLFLSVTIDCQHSQKFNPEMIPCGRNAKHHSHDFRIGPVVQKHAAGGNGKRERAHHAGHVVAQPAEITSQVNEVLCRTNPRRRSISSRSLPGDDPSR